MTPTGKCYECGRDMAVRDDGVSHHLAADGTVDHDADARHVAVSEDEDEVAFWDELAAVRRERGTR